MIEIRVRRVLKARPLPTLLENASRNALLIIRSIPPAHMRRALRAISHVSEPQHGRLLRMMRDYCWDIASCPRIAPSLLSSTPAFPAPDTLLFILMFFWISPSCRYRCSSPVQVMLQHLLPTQVIVENSAASKLQVMPDPYVLH